MKGTGRIITRVGITGAVGRIGTTLIGGLSEKYTLTLFDSKEIQDRASRSFESVKVDLSKVEGVTGIFSGLDAVRVPQS